jgi:hypothetical protein
MEVVRGGLIMTFLPLSSDFDVFLSSLVVSCTVSTFCGAGR